MTRFLASLILQPLSPRQRGCGKLCQSIPACCSPSLELMEFSVWIGSWLSVPGTAFICLTERDESRELNVNVAIKEMDSYGSWAIYCRYTVPSTEQSRLCVCERDREPFIVCNCTLMFCARQGVWICVSLINYNALVLNYIITIKWTNIRLMFIWHSSNLQLTCI